jgi:hypothetical protein
VPDPTKLTTDAVDKVKAELKQIIDERDAQRTRDLENLRQIIEARLDASDIATDLRLEAMREVRPQTERQIFHLRELLEQRFALSDEKFEGVAQQFRERDTRTDQAATASQQALTQALIAAKELVGQQNAANVEAAAKAEASTTKQIDQITVTMANAERASSERTATVEKSLTDRLLELKERIDRGEPGAFDKGESAAMVEARAVAAAQLAVANSHQGAVANRISANALLASAVGLLITVGGIIVAVILARG